MEFVFVKSPAILRTSHRQFGPKKTVVHFPLGIAQAHALLRTVQPSNTLKPLQALQVEVTNPLALPCKVVPPVDGMLSMIVDEAWKETTRNGVLREVYRQYVRLAIRSRDAFAYQVFFVEKLRTAVNGVIALREKSARDFLQSLRFNRRTTAKTRATLKLLLEPLTVEELRVMIDAILDDVYKRLCRAIHAGRIVKKVTSLHGYTYVYITIPENSRARCICTVNYQHGRFEILSVQTEGRFNRQVRFRMRASDEDRRRPRMLRRVS